VPNKGFFGSLLDTSFSSLVTTKVIRFIYILTLIVVSLFALLLIVAGFIRSPALGILFLFIVAPLYWLFALVYVRVGLEFTIALFRVMETNLELVALKRQQMGLPAHGQKTATGSFVVQQPSQAQPNYQVGDVANGHRWNGAEWVPVNPA
jgi:hypothetical protein